MINYLVFILFIHQTAFSDCEYMFGQYYSYFGSFDFEEYVFGEDNCCEEYFFYPCVGMVECISEKEDYADFTDH